MVNREKALKYHRKNPGKLSIEPSVKLEDVNDLNLAYTPGVAEPCKEISKVKEKTYEYTSKGNLVAVVSDGSAVLGLGDIGPEASQPVMEGKCNLFKKFGGVDAFPLCLDTETVEDLVNTVENISPTVGGINLEDIKSPECFEIEKQLKDRLDIPVFHDDQHGTAIVMLAALKNALKLVEKSLSDSKIVILGAGASGIAVSNILIDAGAQNILPVDSSGILRTDDENKYKKDLAQKTLASKKSGSLKDALEGADVLIGLSTGGIVTQEMIETMSENPIVFACANPKPEIMPDEARAGGAEIVATGRSDFDNQVNNSLAFPGVFRGALDARADQINEDMKLAASKAIEDFIEPRKDRIVPETLDRALADEIAENVKEAAEN